MNRNNIYKFFFIALILSGFSVYSQNEDVTEKMSSISTLIDQQNVGLVELANKISQNKIELEERNIVLKYHQGNKEVDQETYDAVEGIKEYNDEALDKLHDIQGEWFDQLQNTMFVYTEYGKLEQQGKVSEDLAAFVSKHKKHLKLIETLKSDIESVYIECDFVLNTKLGQTTGTKKKTNNNKKK